MNQISKYGQSDKNPERDEFAIFIIIIIPLISLLFLAKTHQINLSDYLNLFIGYALMGVILLPAIALVFMLFPAFMHPIVLLLYPFIRLWQRLKKS